jgi:hypothetical protein
MNSSLKTTLMRNRAFVKYPNSTIVLFNLKGCPWLFLLLPKKRVNKEEWQEKEIIE